MLVRSGRSRAIAWPFTCPPSIPRNCSAKVRTGSGQALRAELIRIEKGMIEVGNYANGCPLSAGDLLESRCLGVVGFVSRRGLRRPPLRVGQWSRGIHAAVTSSLRVWKAGSESRPHAYRGVRHRGRAHGERTPAGPACEDSDTEPDREVPHRAASRCGSGARPTRPRRPEDASVTPRKVHRVPVQGGLTAFYSRLTQDDPAGKALSLPNQRKRFLELAIANAWSLNRVYEEPRRVSGELDEQDRPALAELLNDVRAGLVERVVVRHLDRLGRGAVLEKVLAVLRAAGVTIATFDGAVDVSSAAGRLGVRAQAMVGAFEVERAGERIRESKRRRSMEGWYLGPAPFGYTSQARLRAELTALYGSDPLSAERARTEAQRRIPISPGLVVDEAEAGMVREIYRLFVHERQGSRRIANGLNARGELHRGGLWYSQTLQKILRDPKVAGFVTYDEQAYIQRRPSGARIDRQQTFAGKHEAIIDAETWRLAQVLRENGGAKWQVRRQDTRPYPLSGVLLCRNGHHMKGRSNGNGTTPGNAYYICSKRARHGLEHACGCSAPTMQADRAEAAVRSLLARVVGDPSKVMEVVAEANRQLEATAPARRAEVDDVDARIRDAQTRIKRLMAAIENEDDRGKAGEVLDRIMEIRSEVRDLEEKRQDLNSEPLPFPKRVSDAEVTAYLEALRGRLADDPEGFSVLLVELRAHHGLKIIATDPFTIRLVLDLDAGRLGGDARPITLSARVRSRVPFVIDAVAGARPMTAEEWAASEKGKHVCACGCGGQIQVRPEHMAACKGIPTFIHGHHRMNMMEFVAALNAEGLLTVSQAARDLDVGETTLRRLEERGVIHPERRQWGDRLPMRCYRRDELPQLREALASAGFRIKADSTLGTTDLAAALGVAENTVRKWEGEGKIPVARRDTRGCRVYLAQDVERIQAHLAGLPERDAAALVAGGLITRAEAQTLLGIRRRAMQRLISSGKVIPETRVLSSTARWVQVFRRVDIEAIAALRKADRRRWRRPRRGRGLLRTASAATRRAGRGGTEPRENGFPVPFPLSDAGAGSRLREHRSCSARTLSAAIDQGREDDVGEIGTGLVGETCAGISVPGSAGVVVCGRVRVGGGTHSSVTEEIDPMSASDPLIAARLVRS